MTTVRNAVAEVVKLPESDPESPGPFRYGDAHKLLDLLEQAGFNDLIVTAWRGPLAIGGGLPAAGAAEFALRSFSSFSEMLAEAGDEIAKAAREILTAHLLRHQRDGAVKMNACVHLVSGARYR